MQTKPKRFRLTHPTPSTAELHYTAFCMQRRGPCYRYRLSPCYNDLPCSTKLDILEKYCHVSCKTWRYGVQETGEEVRRSVSFRIRDQSIQLRQRSSGIQLQDLLACYRIIIKELPPAGYEYRGQPLPASSRFLQGIRNTIQEG